MDISKLTTWIFGIIFIIFLYLIIYYALKIMYRDIRTPGRRKSPQGRKNYGIEVVNISDSSNVTSGSVILLRDPITIGRKEDNTIHIAEPFVSSYHAKITLKNNYAYIEDLDSTNGVYLNEQLIEGKEALSPGDEIRIGNSTFKVLKR